MSYTHTRRLTLVAALALASALVAPGAASALEGLEPGLPAPDFQLPGLDEKTLSLRELRGTRATLIVFWASSCERSTDVLARAQKLHAAYAPTLTAIGVSVEAQTFGEVEVAAVRGVRDRLKLSFPVLLDHGLRTFAAYGVVAVPSTVVIDGEGTILATLASYPVVGREELFETAERAARGEPIAPTGAATTAGPAFTGKAIRLYNFARSMAARGTLDAADANLAKAIEEDPRFVQPLLLAAEVRMDEAERRDAILFRGVEEDTARPSKEQRRRLLDEAEALLRRALSVATGSAVALTRLGAVRIALGDPMEGERRLREAVQADPTYTPAHAQLGAALYRRGERAAAGSEFAAARALNPLDAHTELLAGEVHEAANETPLAVAAYRRAFELLWPRRRELFPSSYGR